jgi:serine/threonine-protein kinase
MADSPSRIAPGTHLNGIYEVDGMVAAGGMGEVYRGHTIHTGDRVAIKMLRLEFDENDAALALFRKEASALHNLQHEAIVRYYVCSVDPVLQRPYLAMEFVEGQPLSQLLRDGPLTFEAVRTLAQRLAAGLQAAHAIGIIHRDVAPDNIIIPGGDVARAKIIDFGIARSTQLGEGTIIGSGFAGKYNYVSPEQLGLYGGDVTAKSDIYSLGLVLAEAIIGRPIDMGGSQVQVVEKRRNVPDLSAVDMRLRPLLEKMLQPEPANRLDSMIAVANWPLGEAPRAARASASPGGPLANRLPQSRNTRIAVAGGAALLVLILAGGGIYYFSAQPEPTTKPPPPALAANNPAPTPPALSSNAPQPPLSAPTAPPSPSTAAPPALTPPDSSTPAPATPSEQPAPPASPGQLAAVPPLVEPSRPSTPAPAVDPVERITRFINGYDGGDCFFVTPIAVGERAASIEGYGSSVAPFQAFDTAFKQSNGFEADIGLRQVTGPQCPAISFLNQFRAQRATAPRLEISETKLRSGQTLSGSVDGYGDRHIELLLVSDDGSVLNITRLVKPRGTGVTFNLRLQLANAAGSQPQILLAVANARPLGTLQFSEPASAAQLFAAAAAEATRNGQALAVSAKYFKLE